MKVKTSKKICFIKDTEKFKTGEVAEANKRSAEDYVKNGYAEYIHDTIIKKPSPKKNFPKVKETKPESSKYLQTAKEESKKINALASYGVLKHLKEIDVIPDDCVKTKILVSDISPGINILKGYKATCPLCKKSKTVFTKSVNSCDEVFEAENKQKKVMGCRGINGGAIECIFESINDTGFLCGAYDPEDSGSAPQFATVFFSNSIIPKNAKERENFETEIQSKPMIIFGRLIIMPSTKKITEWAIDVEHYEFEEREVKINYQLLEKYKQLAKNDTFFAENYAPKTFGKILNKKIHAVALCSPLKMKLPNGIEMYTVLNIMEAGDPGQDKTGLFMESLRYCQKLTNAALISVENSTNRGLIGAVVKNPHTGQFMVKMGRYTLCNGGFAGLDGYGKLNQFDYAEIRGIQEEHQFQINKAGGIRKECAVRTIAMSNLINPVGDYPTKHKASFDISATTQDKSGKFSGADRRRYDHILVLADADTSAAEIDQHVYLGYNPAKDADLIDYWNNLREFAWSRTPDQIIITSELIHEVSEKLECLRNRYPSFSLDYGVLSKGGLKMFLRQLPAVAIIHGSIDKDNVIISAEHIDWLYDLYLQELITLGLDLEIEQETFYNQHAAQILLNASEKLQEVFFLLYQYGNQSAIEKAGCMSRSSIWRALNEVIKYHTDYQSGQEVAYYCPNQGSGKARLDSWDNIHFEEPDGLLPQLMKQDGTLTPFGKILIRKAGMVKTKNKILPTCKTESKPTETQPNPTLNDNLGITINELNKLLEGFS